MVLPQKNITCDLWCCMPAFRRAYTMQVRFTYSTLTNKTDFYLPNSRKGKTECDFAFLVRNRRWRSWSIRTIQKFPVKVILIHPKGNIIYILFYSSIFIVVYTIVNLYASRSNFDLFIAVMKSSRYKQRNSISIVFHVLYKIVIINVYDVYNNYQISGRW